MKNTDLFKAIDGIDLKYVEKAWGDFSEVNAETAPVTIQPAKKSPMRIFGGAAACVGVIGAAAAAVIIASGSGNMGIASAPESGIDITAAAESEDIFEILKIDYDQKNCEENWELLRSGNEGLSDKDPMQAVKNELNNFKESCISFELKDIYFDEEKGKTFSQAVSNIKAAYKITDDRIAFITADLDAKLDKSVYSYENMTGRWYLLIRDDEGIWYIWSVNQETDWADFEKNSPLWQQLREEQKDFTSTEILTAAQNYITECFGDKEGFVIDRIKYFDDADYFDNLKPEKEKAQDYGIILDDSTFTECSIIPVEAIYRFKCQEGHTHCYFIVYNMVKDSKGNWYIPKDLQVRDYGKVWTWEEQWEKVKENTLYPSKDILETVKKQAEEDMQGDNILSFALKGISENEELTQRERDIYLYGYGIEDLDRVKIAEYDVKFDSSNSLGQDNSDSIVYTLIQDEEGRWYIKDSCDVKDYPKSRPYNNTHLNCVVDFIHNSDCQ